MRISSLIGLAVAASIVTAPWHAHAQIGMPATAVPAARDTILLAPVVPEAPLVLRASVSERMLYVQRGDTTLQTFQVAVGTDEYPTPRGTFTIKKMIWNPRWVPPPNSDWAKGKKARGPGDPLNPMKVVKIFFKEPDYYIHGTDAVGSLGSAASHGCLRMDPYDVARLAKLIMEHGGQPREENWFLRLIHSRREEKPIYLDNPVAITIIG
ncbi:MAG: L,D-transpeptidase family protein [Gemmatimonadota bacterium]|nr:L,D-transpeptidase family protein [Gemmatimonadota bacterium]